MKDRDKQILDASKRARIFRMVDTEGALIKTRKKLGLTSPHKTHIISWQLTLKIAASIVVAFGIGWSIYWSQFAPRWTTITSGDMMLEYRLADGTLVTLNKNSTLRIAQNMTKNRQGTLKGEAFFDVKRDESRPFVISTGGAKVEVLGTSFNILTNEERVAVSVASGRVRVSDEKHEENFVILTKGDAVQLELPDKTMRMNPTDDNYLAWKTGIFTFNNTPVNEALEELAKRHEKDLLLTAELDNCKITTVFDNASWEEIVREFNLIHGLEFSSLSNGQIQVKGGHCE